MFVASVDDDLALLRIDAGGLAGIKMGDTDNPEIGDVVLAIGNP
jgi:S1-C subfamily serine protease